MFMHVCLGCLTTIIKQRPWIWKGVGVRRRIWGENNSILIKILKVELQEDISKATLQQQWSQ